VMIALLVGDGGVRCFLGGGAVFAREVCLCRFVPVYWVVEGIAIVINM